MCVVLPLAPEQEDHQSEEHPADIFRGYAIKVLKTLERHHNQQERERERVPERQPVRHLKTVHSHIPRLDVHKHHHYGSQYAVSRFLLDGYLLIHEIQRHQQKHQSTAVYHRHALRVYRIVSHWEQLCDECQEIKLCRQREIRFSKIELAQFQRIVHRYQHPRRTQQCHHSSRTESQTPQYELLRQCPFRVTEAHIAEVEKREDAHHIADVEMRYEHQRQRHYIRQQLPLFHQPLNAPADKRQVYQPVKPHGVHQLYHHVRHQRIHQREDHQRHRFRLFLCRPFQKETACHRR